MALPALRIDPSKLLERLFCDYPQTSFLIRTPHWEWSSRKGEPPQFTLRFQTQSAIECFLRHPTELTLGEAFIHKDIEIDGDIYAALRLGDYVFQRAATSASHPLVQANRVLAEARDVLVHGPQHSRRRDHQAISHHYDRPPEFFLPWLGPTMVYSCAYFRDPNNTIDQAQTDKLELICRKLALRPGETFLDIGCGWGSLVMHAATRHGARSHGITLSHEQAKFAQGRIAQSGLEAQSSVALKDYRELLNDGRTYDKVASVGMVEHVGFRNLESYFRAAFQVLKPGGLFLNHGIGRSQNSPPAKDSFIQKYVFPDGELVPLHQTIACAEAAGFEVRDVENLREHYALTLRHWVSAIRQNQDALLRIVPEMTYRIWLLYMAGSAVAFDSGDIVVNQVLLRKVDRTVIAMPATREHWFKNWN